MLNVTWSFSFNRLESTIAWGKRVLMNGSMPYSTANHLMQTLLCTLQDIHRNGREFFCDFLCENADPLPYYEKECLNINQSWLCAKELS